MNISATALSWHESSWRLLRQYQQHNRIPQALLISGPVGLGKQVLALQFAKSLLCEHRTPTGIACDHCHACLLFNADTHPDFISLQPEEVDDAQGRTSVEVGRKSGAVKGLGIDKIRTLLPILALKPHGSGFRVVLIQTAEALNNAAANAFLKCLEEPNERTVIILVAAASGRLPATIRSRCQQLKITPPTRQQAIDWLIQQQVTTDHDTLLNIAQGAPFLALQYGKENLNLLHNTCFEQWIQLSKQQISPISLAELWQKHPSAPLLNWMSAWVVDLIKHHHGAEHTPFLNTNLQPLLQETQKQLDLIGLFALYDLLLESQKQFHTQLNKQLIFEGILIQWSNLTSRDKAYDGSS